MSKEVSFAVPAASEKHASPAEDRPNELFHNIASVDFLGFSFNGKGYDAQLKEAVQSTGKFCAVTCEIRSFEVRVPEIASAVQADLSNLKVSCI